MKQKRTYESVRNEYIELAQKLAPPHLQGRCHEIAARDFDELCQRPEVLKVNIGNDCLYVHRAVVYITGDDNLAREIGEYVIRVSTKEVKFENLSRQVSGYHGPHINTSGEMCIGSEHKKELELVLCDGRLALGANWAVDALKVHNSGKEFQAAKIIEWPLCS